MTACTMILKRIRGVNLRAGFPYSADLPPSTSRCVLLPESNCPFLDPICELKFGNPSQIIVSTRLCSSPVLTPIKLNWLWVGILPTYQRAVRNFYSWIRFRLTLGTKSLINSSCSPFPGNCVIAFGFTQNVHVTNEILGSVTYYFPEGRVATIFMLSLIVFILILSCQFNRMLLPPSLFPRPLSMVGHSHPVPLAPMVVSSRTIAIAVIIPTAVMFLIIAMAVMSLIIPMAVMSLILQMMSWPRSGFFSSSPVFEI